MTRISIERLDEIRRSAERTNSFIFLEVFAELDAVRDEYQKYKVYYDRILEKSIVVEASEYAEELNERHQLRMRIEKLRKQHCNGCRVLKEDDEEAAK